MRKSSSSMETIAEELYESLAEVLIRKSGSPFQQAKKKLYDIDVDYFENITRDSEELPEELNLEYKDKVVIAFRQQLCGILSAGRLEAHASPVIAEAVTLYGEDVVKEALPVARKMLKSCPDAYIRDFLVPRHSAEDLRILYEKAKKRSIAERIARSNKADIIGFYHALLDATACACRETIYSIYYNETF